jgi:RNA polymerase sigma factor (sigma-70 family)
LDNPWRDFPGLCVVVFNAVFKDVMRDSHHPYGWLLSIACSASQEKTNSRGQQVFILRLSPTKAERSAKLPRSRRRLASSQAFRDNDPGKKIGHFRPPVELLFGEWESATRADMATAHLSDFLRRLSRGMVAPVLVDQSDGRLVEQFLARRDEAVFAAVVRRHGPMVYRVCWRVLQQEQDTEDAFQATFVVLAQKLHTVRKQNSLASWLHGVAHRVALQAKARGASRRRHEQRASAPPPPDEVTWGELRTALDAELTQLPDKWRLPLILCYLEGRTQDEAADHLGWSRTTLQRRLAEAREALGRRLSRRGVVWPAALSAVLLSDCVAPAALAPGLVGSTVEAAACVANGRAAISGVSANVAVLTEGVLKAMLLTKLKIATAVLMVLTLIGAGSVVLTRSLAAVGPTIGNPTHPDPTFAKLATRKLELEVKEPEKQIQNEKKEAFTAWGKEVGGLQAGLGYPPGQRRTYYTGETAKFLVRVRNVSKDAVKFQYFPLFVTQHAPTVADGVGKIVDFRYGLLDTAIVHLPEGMNLAPGKEIVLGEVELLTTLLGTGRFTVHYERVFGRTYQATVELDPVLSKLATGKLELEVKEARKKEKDEEKRLSAADEPQAQKAEQPKEAEQAAVPKSIVGADQGVQRVVWSPNGKFLATLINVYDIHEYEFKGETKKVLLDHCTLMLWDVEKKEWMPTTVALEAKMRVWALAISPDSKTLTFGLQDLSTIGRFDIRLVDVETGKEKKNFPFGEEAGAQIRGIVFTSNDTLAVWGRDVEERSVMKVFDVEMERPKGVVSAKADRDTNFTCFAFSSDGKSSAFAIDSTIRVAKPGAKETVPLEGHSKHIFSLAFSPDGKFLVSGSSDSAKVWDLSNDQLLHTLTADDQSVNSVALSPDGKTVAIGIVMRNDKKVAGQEVKLFDVQTGNLKRTLKARAGTVAFSPDGRTLATGGLGVEPDLKTVGELRLWPVGKQ